MKNRKSGVKTLFLSIIMSSPGPLVVGLALIQCKSSTQIADFVRRTAEFLAIVISFFVFKLTVNKKYDTTKKICLEEKSNVFVGLLMCIAGLTMGIIALLVNKEDEGNVIPGLVIAVFSLIGNSIFWRKYNKLNKIEPNSIMKVQLRLYRAKTLVDASVTITLTSILIIQNINITYWIDMFGSLIVAGYLIWNGTRTIVEVIKSNRKNHS